MDTTTVGTFLPALRDALKDREGLTEVPVWTAEPPGEATATEAVIFGAVEADQEWGALGKRRRAEAYSVTGWTLAASYGTDEEAVTAARNRALALYGELCDCLSEDPTVGGTVQEAHCGHFSLFYGVGGSTGNARVAYVEFTIETKATLRMGA